MNDDTLEQHLRELPASELPATWRAEILSTAWRESGRSAQPRQVWPTLLVYLRNLCLHNPVTASAMTVLWILIIVFKAGTPVDPGASQLLVRIDPNHPIYLLSVRDEILLAHLEEEESEQKQLRQIP